MCLLVAFVPSIVSPARAKQADIFPEGRQVHLDIKRDGVLVEALAITVGLEIVLTCERWGRSGYSDVYIYM
jgi:hypothetical protein